MNKKVYVVMERSFESSDWETNDSRIAIIKSTPEAATKYVDEKAKNKTLTEDKIVMIGNIPTRKIGFFTKTAEYEEYFFAYWVEEHNIED